MIFRVVTLFPDQILSGLSSSIIKRAIDNKIIELDLINIRDFANNRHGKVDDYPYGGGPGMLMQAPPVVESVRYALGKAKKPDTEVLYLSPKGQKLDANLSKQLAKEEEIILLCGHYEGIDERAIDLVVTREVSIGDYILTGGEIAAMVLIDAVSRYVKGVVSNQLSIENESHVTGLLEAPHYTRPYIFEGREVPKVLLSGHHKNIENYRLKESLRLTLFRRPDLLEKRELSQEEKNILNEIRLEYGLK